MPELSRELSNEKLFYIGGIVRDIILGIECFDIDITYVGDAIEFSKNLKDIKILKINEPFGTVKIKIDNKEIDLASTRNEIYPKAGHLPIVTEIGCDLKKDIQRRDFTINTLAKSLQTGEIIDYLGGQKDIKNKLIRVLHNKSFIDDPTRIIRALKFSVRFGFELEENTQRLQDEYLKNINYDMSYKRLKKELIETFNLNSQKAYEKFFDENIYKLLTTKSYQKKNFNIQTLINKYPVKNTWLVYLGNIDLSSLPLTKKEQKIIDDFNRLMNTNLKDDYIVYKEFKTSEKESILLYAINNNKEIVEKYFEKHENISLKITGQDLQRMGIPPSAKYAECFEFILKQKIANPNIDEIATAKLFFK